MASYWLRQTQYFRELPTSFSKRRTCFWNVLSASLDSRTELAQLMTYWVSPAELFNFCQQWKAGQEVGTCAEKSKHMVPVAACYQVPNCSQYKAPSTLSPSIPSSFNPSLHLSQSFNKAISHFLWCSDNLLPYSNTGGFKF